MTRVAAACITFLLLDVLMARAQDAAPPRVLDPSQAAQAVRSVHPRDLRLLGIGGIVALKVRVLPNGAIDSTVVVTSSGVPSLDRAAEAATVVMRFSRPSEPQWVEMSLEFVAGPSASAVPSLLPRLANRSEVEDDVWRRLPARVRRERFQVTVTLDLQFDASGKVVDARPTESICPREFSDAAMQTVPTMRFAFPDSADRPRARRTIATFAFQDSAAVRLAGEASETRPRRQGPIPFPDSVFTVRPSLRNAEQVERELQRVYPPQLRDSGRGGTVSLWLFIDEQGNPIRRTVRGSSGDCRLDLAALAVAKLMRFEPALSNGTPTKVWVDMPVIFRTRR